MQGRAYSSARDEAIAPAKVRPLGRGNARLDSRRNVPRKPPFLWEETRVQALRGNAQFAFDKFWPRRKSRPPGLEKGNRLETKANP
ncbi:MAG TPA: hypothetical protein ENN07_00740 [candidate division Zixibacteria bacterium]|nr:hypothetical protein [candidate division Zixibacteria bacterium]